MPLDADTVRLATGNNLATVVTLMPDGQPQALPTWVDTDGDHILINTEPQRQRARNLARDPTVTVLICARGNPYDWTEVRGHVVATVTGDNAIRHLRTLHHRYERAELADCAIGPHGRVILVIAPDKINTPETVPGHPPRDRGGAASP